MGLLRKFQHILLRSTLLTIYKTFIRSWLDYADTIYDQAYNSAFPDKLESIQYNACLAITGAIRGTSIEKIYLELGLESLKSRRWFRKLSGPILEIKGSVRWVLKRTLFLQANHGTNQENFALKILSDGRKQHPKT